VSHLVDCDSCGTPVAVVVVVDRDILICATCYGNDWCSKIEQPKKVVRKATKKRTAFDESDPLLG